MHDEHPQANPILESTSTQAFSDGVPRLQETSFGDQSMIERDNSNPQEMRNEESAIEKDNAQEQTDYSNPPDNEVNNDETIRGMHNEMVVTAVMHNPPMIVVEHDGAAAAHSDQTSHNNLDDTLMEETVWISQHKMVLKKDYWSEEAVGAESGSKSSRAAAAVAPISYSLDVEQGQSLTKAISPMREKVTNMTKAITTRARWVTSRLSTSPKKTSRLDDGDQSCTEAPSETRKTPKKKNIKKGKKEEETPKKEQKEDESSDDDEVVLKKPLQSTPMRKLHQK